MINSDSHSVVNTAFLKYKIEIHEDFVSHCKIVFIVCLLRKGWAVNFLEKKKRQKSIFFLIIFMHNLWTLSSYFPSREHQVITKSCSRKLQWHFCEFHAILGLFLKTLARKHQPRRYGGGLMVFVSLLHKMTTVNCRKNPSPTDVNCLVLL